MWPLTGHPTLTSLLTVCLLNPTLVILLPVASVFDNLPGNYYACNIKPVFKDSPYIKAFTEVSENGHGCFSNETNNGTEVHVVFLTNRNRNNGEVYLEVISKNKKQVHSNPLILILGSRRQVNWKVRLPNIGNGKGEHLIVTYIRSTVKFTKKVDYVDISKYGNFPTRAKKLLKWVSNKFQAVTSYTWFHSKSRHLRLQVGINSKAPLQCTLRKKAKTPYASTISYNGIPFGGCAVNRNQDFSFSPKHIIEVVGARKSPLNEINIELRSFNGKNSNVNMILVLKASDDVVWVIRSRKIMGSLEIHSNHEVKTDHVMMPRVALNREKLYASGRNLVNWAGEHTYGYISSYTNISRVDKITLSVEGTSLDQSFKPDKTKNSKPDVRDPSLVSPFANPVKTKAVLQAAMQTSCFPDGLVVHINSSLTKMYGLKHDQITLDDPVCRAEKINDYFVLRSSYSNCQTVLHKSSPLKYSNKLKIHHSPMLKPLQPLKASKVTQFEGSGVRNDGSEGDDDDSDEKTYDKKQGSGSGYLLPLDDTHMDDEDYRFQNIMIDFSCSPNKKITPMLKYHLDFYDDPLYSNLYDHSPFYTTKEKFIYVKARVSGDSHYGVQILNCALTEYGRSIQPLLDKGCPAQHSGLKWQGNNELGMEYFSFKVNPHVAEGVEHQISCTVIACAKDITLETGTWKTQQCTSPKEFCATYSEQNSFIGKQLVKVVGEVSFVVHSGKTLFCNKNNRLPTKTSIKQVTVQGLESGTVIGIAFSAFIIGVLLTATLWFIQVYTDPQKREAKRRIEGSTTETSADSTPCSFSPISM